MIDAMDEINLINARKEIDKLSNEEELRETVFCFLYNVKEGVNCKKNIDDIELEDKKKYLDHSIGMDDMHTFKIRKSFIINITDIEPPKPGNQESVSGSNKKEESKNQDSNNPEKAESKNQVKEFLLTLLFI